MSTQFDYPPEPYSSTSSQLVKPGRFGNRVRQVEHPLTRLRLLPPKQRLRAPLRRNSPVRRGRPVAACSPTWKEKSKGGSRLGSSRVWTCFGSKSEFVDNSRVLEGSTTLWKRVPRLHSNIRTYITNILYTEKQ